MTIVSVESERFENMELVAEWKFKGYNDTQIAKQLAIPRKDVKVLWQDYQTALSNDAEARDMARDHLFQMVKHYDSLIKKFYELVDEIDTLSFNHQVAGQKNATLKSIAELEAKRLDLLQKAGLLESAELGDELAEMEEKKDILVSIIRDNLCDACRAKVASKISEVTGQAEPVKTYDVEIVKDNIEVYE